MTFSFGACTVPLQVAWIRTGDFRRWTTTGR